MKEFQNLYNLSWKKLDNLMKNYEGLDILKAVRVFDPAQLEALPKKHGLL